MLRLFLIGLLIISILSCTQKNELTEAKELAEKYYSSLESKNYANVQSYFAPEIADLATSQEWTQKISDLIAQCGEISTFSFISYSIKSSFMNKEKSVVVLTYKVDYKNYYTKEIFLIGFDKKKGVQIKNHELTLYKYP